MAGLQRILLIFLALGTQLVRAQPETIADKEVVFDQPPQHLGLSQRSINCITQDREGYLWMGSWEGLIKYDGYSTVVFQSDNQTPHQLKSNKILDIFEDRNGILWIGTHMGGLFSYNKNTNRFTQYTHDPQNGRSLSNDNVWSIVQDQDGIMWIGAEDGLNKFDPEKKVFTRYYSETNDPNTLTDNFITHLHIDGQDRLWAATERGLNLISREENDISVHRFMYEKDPENFDLHNYIYKITSLEKDGETLLFWSSKKGLKQLKGDRIVCHEYADRPPSFSFFRTLYPVPGDNPFILTGSEMGFNIFDVQKERFVKFYGNYDERSNLSHNTVQSIFIDRSGTLWVGAKKGINKFNTYSKGFELHLTSSFDETKSIITGIQGSAEKGAYWVSTIGGGLYKFYRNEGKAPRFQRFKVQGEGNDFSDFVQTLYSDEQGNVWIGAAGGGVYYFDELHPSNVGGAITAYRQYNKTSSEKISDDYIMSIAGANDGGVWVGAWSGGLNHIDQNGEVTVFENEVLKKAPLVALYQDKDNVLWIGSRGSGLFKAVNDGGKLVVAAFESHTGANTLSNNFINVIYEDHAGALWVGSEGGLDLFDRRTETFRRYDIPGQFNSGVVVGMLEDNQGRLWLSHWNGLSEIDPSSEDLLLNNYDVSDRVQGGFFYNNVCYKDKQGRLLFGGSNGFNVIDPSHINHNPHPPLAAIKNFRIFNEPVNVNEEFNGRIILNKSLDSISTVNLRHNENSISFELASVHFAAPEKNRLAYILEGFENTWQNTDASRRYVNYTNLPPGDYTFRVKASNNDGVWSQQEKTLRIFIGAPWWKTEWAIVAYAVFIVLILFIFRQLILMRANFINRIKLERMSRENIEKLNKAKLQFFTNVSHEFRTPLTLIQGPLEKILNSGEGALFFKEQLAIINRNTQRLLRLVNQLMDFRKIEAGNMKLKAAEGNIVKFVEEVKLSFDGLAEELQAKFTFHATSSEINAWYDRDQFEKIMFNLLSNAFKNIRKNGAVSISLFKKQDHVEIVIEDDGRGIKKESLPKIFERFYSGDDHAHPGTGIGLALTKSLVEMHRGTIDVESEENKFTRFTVKIPLGYSHFDPSEAIHDFKDSEYEGHYKLVESLPEEEVEAVEEAAATEETAERKKILVVEDNEEVRRYVKSLFSKKYLVIEAGDGQEGKDMALQELPDLIISDVMMPALDGINFCKQIKSNVKTSHIPVVLLTARTSLIHTVEGLEKGADDYITKPFNPKILELKVRNLINARERLKKIYADNEVLNIEPKQVTLTSADEKFIEKALESIEQNMSNSEYAIKDLGRDVGFSRMQLYRKLKALTGLSTNEFIRNIRLKRAAQLIEQDQLTIAEVTYEVGFTDLQYFRSCFKKQFGVNPSEYGKKTIETKN